MSNASVVAAVRDGGWRRLDVGRFEVVVAVACLLDWITTMDILLAGRGEANQVLAGLAETDVRLAMAFFTWAVGLTLLVTWLDLAWLSTVFGTMGIVSYGSGGLHNLIGVTTGWYPKTALPLDVATQVHYVEPTLGLLLGLVLAYRWHGALPPREVGAYLTLYLADNLWPHLLF